MLILLSTANTLEPLPLNYPKKALNLNLKKPYTVKLYIYIIVTTP